MAPTHVSGELIHEVTREQQNAVMALILRLGTNADVVRYIQGSGMLDPAMWRPIDETGETYMGRALECVFASLISQALHYAAPNTVYNIPLGTATRLTAVMGIPAREDGETDEEGEGAFGGTHRRE
ncbi:hypothetical protein HDU88_002052 [Geranomyces variabilis]|nr:hypothetical protein HDU88_002052 [Geranomyces variabilis]